jgi:hypothetical protein
MFFHDKAGFAFLYDTGYSSLVCADAGEALFHGF